MSANNTGLPEPTVIISKPLLDALAALPDSKSGPMSTAHLFTTEQMLAFRDAGRSCGPEEAACAPPSFEPATAKQDEPSHTNNDTEIIDWLERQHTLHRSVEAVYVVDGYLVSAMYDGEPLVGKKWHGKTLREACAKAMQEYDTTHGNNDLIAERAATQKP